VPNLNPAQLAKTGGGARPMSASLRTPRGQEDAEARMRARLRREDQLGTPRQVGTPRLPLQPDVQPGEEEPWLFRFERSLTTADVWKMGFSRVIIFGAHHWTTQKDAAEELSDAFLAGSVLAGMGYEHKETLEAMIAPAFLKGDVLLAVQCTQVAMLPSEAERAACLDNVAKFVDAVSNVWTQYDEMGEANLGAVVVVIEGYADDTLTADWGETPIVYPVTPLDEDFSSFFK